MIVRAGKLLCKVDLVWVFMKRALAVNISRTLKDSRLSQFLRTLYNLLICTFFQHISNVYIFRIITNWGTVQEKQRGRRKSLENMADSETHLAGLLHIYSTLACDMVILQPSYTSTSASCTEVLRINNSQFQDLLLICLTKQGHSVQIKSFDTGRKIEHHNLLAY